MTRSNTAPEYGPEIYSTTCGALIAGQYPVKLNLYSGQYGITSTTASVLIRIGTQWFSKQV